MAIHKTAIVSETAIIPDSCEIGPNVVIGENVKLGENVKVGSGAYLEYCEIGDDSIISPYAIIGTPPQDLGYKGEPTKVILGKGCQIKEFVTINRASGEGTATVLGDRCFIMASAHIAHNCVLGDDVIMANLATIGGHVHVGKCAWLGGMTVYHQNCTIGEYTIVSGFSASRMDIPPYCKADGRPAVSHGINVVGLKRRGFTLEQRTNLKNAYKVLESCSMRQSEAADKIDSMFPNDEHVHRLAQFIRESKRGVCFEQHVRKLHEEVEE